VRVQSRCGKLQTIIDKRNHTLRERVELAVMHAEHADSNVRSALLGKKESLYEMQTWFPGSGSRLITLAVWQLVSIPFCGMYILGRITASTVYDLTQVNQKRA